jgi:hypothetical protein
VTVWHLQSDKETALTKKGAYYDLEADLFEDVHQRFHGEGKLELLIWV